VYGPGQHLALPASADEAGRAQGTITERRWGQVAASVTAREVGRIK